MIGAVIKGETLHDEVIAHAIANIAAQVGGASSTSRSGSESPAPA